MANNTNPTNLQREKKNHFSFCKCHNCRPDITEAFLDKEVCKECGFYVAREGHRPKHEVIGNKGKFIEACSHYTHPPTDTTNVKSNLHQSSDTCKSELTSDTTVDKWGEKIYGAQALPCCKVCQCDNGAGKKIWCACHRRQIREVLSHSLQQAREDNDKKWRERIEKAKLYPSGKCPFCNPPKGRSVSTNMLHPAGADEHVHYYNKALSDLLTKGGE